VTTSAAALAGEVTPPLLSVLVKHPSATMDLGSFQGLQVPNRDCMCHYIQHSEHTYYQAPAYTHAATTGAKLSVKVLSFQSHVECLAWKHM